LCVVNAVIGLGDIALVLDMGESMDIQSENLLHLS